MRDTSLSLASSSREKAVANGNPSRISGVAGGPAQGSSFMRRYLQESIALVFRPSWSASIVRESLLEETRALFPASSADTTLFEDPSRRSDLGTVSPFATSDIHTSRFPAWKRTLDLACIFLSLPLWLMVMLLVMLWIKLVSPGPIFYRQERIGRNGKRFVLLKFRSMRVNVETQSHERHFEELIRANCPMNKLDSAGDPRLILGGRLIRALGLDELPQILNVIRGEMSIVGPRPCTPHEFEHYQPWQRERVSAPPGLTGYWQVNGKNKTTFSEMIAMDIFYADNMSLCLDCEIILRTASVLVSQALESRPANRVVLALHKSSPRACEG